MKKFLTVALAGVLAASMLFTGCSKKEESKVPDKLIVGTNAEFPPFEYMNDKKQPDGFDIAMIKEIGKRMDKKVEIQNMEFKSLIGAMESNSINTIIAGMTKTKERQKSVDFSDSYYTSNQAIILKKDSKIKKLSQLEGKKVGVQEGTTGDIIASSKEAVELCILMFGIVGLWSGLMNIALSLGITTQLQKLLTPFLTFLFPNLKNQKAKEYISTNIVANILGLGWAATPSGLKAMEELQKDNPDKNTATNEMCSFLILNISSLQLIPINIIAYRSQYGSVNPSKILIPGLIATLGSTIVAVIYIKWKDRKR